MKFNLNIDHTNIKWFLFYSFLYFSLVLSLILGENSTGGAILDYTNQKKISEDFSLNFYKTFFNFDQYSTRHSPVLIIFLSIFERFDLPDILIRFIHLNLCLLLPLFFFKCINLIFRDKKIAFFLSSLIFLSPTFRSLGIWPDSRVLGLTFFTISIYEYLKFNQKKKFKNCLKNILFVSIAAYISPNFSLFAIFYFLNYVIFYRKKIKNIFYIVLLNLILSAPAFIYLFYLESNFLFKTAAVNLNNELFLFSNIFNKILLISSIIFFYLIPFYFLKIFKINKNQFSLNYFILSLALTLISIYFFNYKYEYTGGGIFFKLSYMIFQNNFLFYFISFLSVYFIINLINFKYSNILLFLLLLLSNPQLTIYHKYYDPFMLILFFTILNINLNIKILKNNNSKIFIFLYFFIFLTISNLKSYVL